MRMLTDVETLQLKNDPTIYFKGLIVDGSKSKSVVLAAAAAVLTAKLINNFRPQYISMVGIAAGKRGQKNYGDIIIPTEVWDYGSGKIVSVDDSKEGETEDFLFQPDPKYLDLDVEIKEIINKDYSKQLSEIKRTWPSDKPETSLSLVVGPMACGSVVVQNDEIIKRFIDPYNRKLKGLDMESYGVFYAVENFFTPKPKVIVCKSVCDFGDKDKNDSYQAYSAYTSAAFLKYLALNEFSWPISEIIVAAIFLQYRGSIG